MNTEDFVTYEQAVALKKLGFKEECFYHYDYNNPNDIIPNTDICQLAVSVNDFNLSYNNSDSFYDQIYYDAPTLAQAQKWLIKEKHYYVEPDSDYIESWLWDIVNLRNGDLIHMWTTQGQPNHYKSYEDALSAGITELIKILTTNKNI